MKKIIFAVLFCIWVLTTLFIRLYGLDRSPITVGYDEAALGYNSYSILLTGKDEYGIPHPLSLRSFNDFKPALYSYIAVPFIHFIGLNQTSVRAPSAVLGSLALIVLYFIFKKISNKSALICLLVITFISFLPWRIHFSRVALETNISMVFFTCLGWCLINFKKNWFYKIGVVLFSTLAIYSYHAARAAVPTFLFLFLVDPISLNLKSFFKNPLKSVIKLWPLAIVLLLYIPLFVEFKASMILTRFNLTNIFSHFYPFTPRELIFAPNVWLNLLANPLYYLGGIFTGHFSAYFSPKNLSLLIYPGVMKSAQVISGTGMVGFTGGILFAIGLLSNIKELINNNQKRIIIYWILAGIAPAAITWEWFYPLRSLNIYPAIDIVIGLGLISTIDYVAKNYSNIFKYLIYIVIGTVITSSSIYNVLNEYNFGAWDTNGEFQPGGFKESAPLLLSLKDRYKTIYLDSNQAESYILFLFYLKYPPQNIQKLAATRTKPGVEGPPDLNFDNFIYKKYDWTHDKYKNNFVYWTNSEVKEEEINAVPNAKLYKILGPTGNWIASIITKP